MSINFSNPKIDDETTVKLDIAIGDKKGAITIYNDSSYSLQPTWLISRTGMSKRPISQFGPGCTP